MNSGKTDSLGRGLPEAENTARMLSHVIHIACNIYSHKMYSFHKYNRGRKKNIYIYIAAQGEDKEGAVY